jgi:hypothetical protein
VTCRSAVVDSVEAQPVETAFGKRREHRLELVEPGVAVPAVIEPVGAVPRDASDLQLWRVPAPPQLPLDTGFALGQTATGPATDRRERVHVSALIR